MSVFSVRQQKVASSIEHWLHGLHLQERYPQAFADTHLVAVEMSRDLSLARIWMIAHEGVLPAKQVKAMNALSRSLRYELAQHIAIKKVPSLRFLEDQLTLQQHRLSGVFEQLFPDGLTDE